MTNALSIVIDEFGWGVQIGVVDSDRQMFKVEVWRPRVKYGEMQTVGEVNWQAIGDTTPEVTRKVAEALRLAAEYAEQLEPEED